MIELMQDTVMEKYRFHVDYSNLLYLCWFLFCATSVGDTKNQHETKEWTGT